MLRSLISKSPFLQRLLKSIRKFFLDSRFWLCPPIQISSVYEYCSECLLGEDLRIMDPDDICDTVAQKAYLDEEPCEHIIAAVHVPPAYITKLGDVCVIGESDYMVAGNRLLCDRKMTAPASLLEFNPDTLYISADTKTAKLRLKPTRHIEKAIVMTARWAANYTHFALEVLSRLQIADEYAEYRDWPLLLDSAPFRTKNLVDFLGFINNAGHSVITISQDEICKISQCVFPSPLTYFIQISSNSRPFELYGAVVSPRAVTYLRNCLEEVVPEGALDSFGKKRFFLYRGDNRRFVNEDEVARYFSGLGFEVVDPGRMTLIEQVKLFRSACIVVAAHGTALMNVLWMPPGSSVIEICPKRFDNYTWFANIALSLGIHYYTMPATLLRDAKVINGSAFALPLEACQDMMSRYRKIRECGNSLPLMR